MKLIGLSLVIALALGHPSGTMPVPRTGIDSLTRDLATAYGEIKEGIRSLKESYDSVNRFINSVSSLIDAIASLMDPAAFVLLLVVLLLSAGFSSIGIPKGRFSFFLSLAAADTIWFLWNRSIAQAGFEFLGGMIKANLYLLLPYVTISLCVRGAGFLHRRYAYALSTRFWFMKTKKDREELRFLADTFREGSKCVSESLEHDIAAADIRAGLSKTTRMHIDALDNTMRKINN
jgi:hypothetical protein